MGIGFGYTTKTNTLTPLFNLPFILNELPRYWGVSHHLLILLPVYILLHWA